MRNTVTAPKKSRELMIKYPKMSKKEYKAAWRNFWRLGKKLNRLWKTKKSSLEILGEERR